MKPRYEEGDLVLFANIDKMPNDLLLGEDDKYSQSYRDDLFQLQKNQVPFIVTDVDDHGETIYVESVPAGDTYCFNEQYFKPTTDTLAKQAEAYK